MRYSKIIGDGFFNIGLTNAQKALVDAHYVGAAHHRYRALMSVSVKSKYFHNMLYVRHLRALFSTIAKGDFSRAKDHFQQGLDSPLGWKRPSLDMIANDAIRYVDPMLMSFAMPDPTMFDEFPGDRRYLEGDEHPHDAVLENPSALPQSLAELMASSRMLKAL